MNKNDYLKNQIMTYMGNKRKFLPIIENILDNLTHKLGRKLNIGEFVEPVSRSIDPMQYVSYGTNPPVRDIASPNKWEVKE